MEGSNFQINFLEFLLLESITKIAQTDVNNFEKSFEQR
jgi:hypothetical protein